MVFTLLLNIKGSISVYRCLCEHNTMKGKAPTAALVWLSQNFASSEIFKYPKQIVGLSC